MFTKKLHIPLLVSSKVRLRNSSGRGRSARVQLSGRLHNVHWELTSENSNIANWDYEDANDAIFTLIESLCAFCELSEVVVHFTHYLN
jgi:hypothetical protein